MSETPLPLRGAVDLAALAAQSKREESGLATVDEAGLQALAEQSLQAPVIIAFVSSRVPASDQVATQLDRLARSQGGISVAACDVDAEPAIAQAFQISTVPAAVALIGARPAPLFQGAATAEQLEQLVGQVAQVAQQAGLGGAAAAEQPAAPEEPPLPPLIQEAYDAVERGDLAAAEAAFDKALTENPKDEEARAGRAQVRLMARSRTADLGAVRAAAAAAPDDVDAQLAVADMDVLGGQVEDAFVRLIDVVRVTAGDDRDRVRARLLELFDVVGGQDPRVLRARQTLASALY
ncbi:tetratricopeptide repeat protein [Demequina sp. SYSU T00068]|uniref:co-chaperone YbbN n=1 Tax=Demequina lignilytica TaxID=3051663 RepID=UPI00261EA5D8|nr:tetratricopeptide repeat protein [Demequina sp. SYSU T00068]MDN4490285.1 tetratricopeptide repeat protein [Demequina sp. SYSU T00068]